jgi:hypothetical protein
MADCKNSSKILKYLHARLTWGNSDQGKLGHTPKIVTKEEKATLHAENRRRGYSPKNYADENEIGFVEIPEGKKVVQVACGF